jgi:GINS complex subunit 1
MINSVWLASLHSTEQHQSKMYTEDAVMLLKELKQHTTTIAAYNDEKVRNVIREMNKIYQDVQTLLANEPKCTYDPGYAISLVTRHHVLRRNQRCLLAYLSHRLDQIREIVSQHGPMIPNFIKPLLSGKELEFYRHYARLLSQYRSRFPSFLLGNITDIGRSQQLPPKSLYIEVRVLQDCGDIETEHGTLHLKKGDTYYVRLDDVEHLIRQGYLAPILS